MSRIVKAAGISQGSFYTYFDGKEDLRQYLIGRIGVGLLSWFFEQLDQHEGNICDTALYAVAKIIKLDRKSPEFRMVENTILDTGWTGRISVFEGNPEATIQKEFYRFSKVCYERTDLKTVRLMDENGFDNLLELLIIIILKSAICYVAEYEDCTKILMSAERQIQLLRA